VTSPLLVYSTAQRPSTLRITTSYFASSASRLACMMQLTSHLRDRLQCVQYGGRQSEYKTVNYGVPQGSVLGPFLFIIDTAELCSLVTAHHLHPLQYADDVQTYGWRPPTESNAQQDQLSCKNCNHFVKLNE